MAGSQVIAGTKCTRCVWILLCVFALSFRLAAAVGELYGFRVEIAEGTFVDNGTTIVYADQLVTLRLFGRDFTSGSELSFTTKPAERGEDCTDLRSTDVCPIQFVTSYIAISEVRLQLQHPDTSGTYYFCVRESNSTLKTTDGAAAAGSVRFFHQGTDPWLVLKTEPKPVHKTLMPIWLQICVVVVLLSFSGLFSGLNLGLMSLDKTELSIMENSGTPREKRYAKTIHPVRKRGNFLLCTILLGNVLVNNTLAILLDDLTGSGMIAIIGATLGIVIFGEIIPQAFCSRYGLAVGARTIWFTKFFMVLTFPLSYPISRLLDCILGEEIGYVYNRDRLRELLRVTEKQMDLKKDEVNIIAGALELSKKTVGSVMTKIDDVFMIEYDSILDFDTMSLIMKTGYTRIPVYEKDRSNIVALLNIKDLAFIDPDDRTPLQTVCKFYNHPVNFIFEDTRLDIMLEEFKKGKSHMAVVQTINDKGPGDPFYETVGLVTLEDVIEEIIQSEIIDETDTVTDNRVRAPRKSHVKDFSIFNQPDDHNYPRLSPQLTLATFQYLSTSVTPFKADLISEGILQRLIKQNVIINFHLTDPTSDDCYLYHSGKPCDHFIMVLQGRVQVEFGKENLTFEGGPFVYFGVQALVLPQTLLKQTSVASMTSLSDVLSTAQQSPTAPYIPDYTVRATTDLQYIRIRRAHYIVALRATLLERRHRQQQPDGLQGGTQSHATDDEEDTFTKEWRRAQSAFANSNTLDGTRSEVGSVRDVTFSQPSFDGTVSEGGNRTDFSGGTSPVDHRTVLSSGPGGESADIPLLEAGVAGGPKKRSIANIYRDRESSS